MPDNEEQKGNERSLPDVFPSHGAGGWSEGVPAGVTTKSEEHHHQCKILRVEPLSLVLPVVPHLGGPGQHVQLGGRGQRRPPLQHARDSVQTGGQEEQGPGH